MRLYYTANTPTYINIHVEYKRLYYTVNTPTYKNIHVEYRRLPYFPVYKSTFHPKFLDQLIVSHGWPATPGHLEPPLIHNSRNRDRMREEF